MVTALGTPAGLQHQGIVLADLGIHDPMRLTDGVEPPEDPILRSRAFVYAGSVRRRSGA